MTEYILIVDDQFPIRSMLQKFLWESGYRAQCAANGWECLKITRSKERPSLLLLDYQMPGKTGIKKDNAAHNVPVIIISATEDLEETAKTYGARAVLDKPVDLKPLLEAIHNIMV